MPPPVPPSTNALVPGSSKMIETGSTSPSSYHSGMMSVEGVASNNNINGLLSNNNSDASPMKAPENTGNTIASSTSASEDVVEAKQ